MIWTAMIARPVTRHFLLNGFHRVLDDVGHRLPQLPSVAQKRRQWLLAGH
jgi:hypothetical protein